MRAVHKIISKKIVLGWYLNRLLRTKPVQGLQIHINHIINFFLMFAIFDISLFCYYLICILGEIYFFFIVNISLTLVPTYHKKK